MRTTVAGYREVLGDPTTRRLLSASVVSTVGDFVGAGALLVLAYERAGGRAIAAGGFLAATGAGSLAVALLGGPLLDRVPRRTGLVGAEIAGAFALLLPLMIDSLWPTYVTALVLGTRRSVSVAVRHGLLADAVDDRLRSGLLGLLGTTDQLGQVIGYVTGATLAVAIGAAPALALDMLTMVLGAAILWGLRMPARETPESYGSVLDGWRNIFGHPQLRLLALLIAASAAASALPETLASSAVGTDSGWMPILLAAGPAGGVVGFIIAGRLRSTVLFWGQLSHLTAYGAVVVLGALVSGPLGLTLVNLGAGAGAAWLIGPQVAFVRLAPTAHVAKITASMVALVMLSEGGWVLLAGAVADRFGVQAAYGTAALVVLGAAAIGWTIHLRRGDARDRWDPAPEDADPPTQAVPAELGPGVTTGADRAG